jgi:hypothetical protein
MGEQIHVGGMASSTDLASHAGITPAMHGIDAALAAACGSLSGAGASRQ